MRILRIFPSRVIPVDCAFSQGCLQRSLPRCSVQAGDRLVSERGTSDHDIGVIVRSRCCSISFSILPAILPCPSRPLLFFLTSFSPSFLPPSLLCLAYFPRIPGHLSLIELSCRPVIGRVSVGQVDIAEEPAAVREAMWEAAGGNRVIPQVHSNGKVRAPVNAASCPKKARQAENLSCLGVEVDACW